jgi:hypothetical protein
MKKTLFIILILSCFGGANAQLCDLGDAPEKIHDTIRFDSTRWYLTADTAQFQIWQVGIPHKTKFNVAFKGQRAIVTDTVFAYPSNNSSHFDLKVGKFNFGQYFFGNLFFQINHKLDTDTLRDGGYISISYDGGATFTNIISDTLRKIDLSPARDYYNRSKNLYTRADTLFNGEYGFSGTSEDWITTRFAWHNLPAAPNKEKVTQNDTLILRFTFVSDSIDNPKDGWMIDDITLYSCYLGSGIEDINVANLNLYPNPAEHTVQLDFNRVANYTLSLVNTLGELCISKTIKNLNKEVLEIQHLPSGIYFIYLTEENGLVSTHKLVIK